MNENEFKLKYLKYKSKYLELKNQYNQANFKFTRVHDKENHWYYEIGGQSFTIQSTTPPRKYYGDSNEYSYVINGREVINIPNPSNVKSGRAAPSRAAPLPPPPQGRSAQPTNRAAPQPPRRTAPPPPLGGPPGRGVPAPTYARCSGLKTPIVLRQGEVKLECSLADSISGGNLIKTLMSTVNKITGKNYRVLPIPADGNCFFYSIVEILFRNSHLTGAKLKNFKYMHDPEYVLEKKFDDGSLFPKVSYQFNNTYNFHFAHQLRILVSMIINSNLEYFQPLLEAENYDINTYIEKLKYMTAEIWAGPIEIMITCQLFNIEIYVLNIKNNELLMYHYSPTGEIQIPRDISQYINNREFRTSIYVSRIENHYFSYIQN